MSKDLYNTVVVRQLLRIEAAPDGWDPEFQGAYDYLGERFNFTLKVTQEESLDEIEMIKAFGSMLETQGIDHSVPINHFLDHWKRTLPDVAPQDGTTVKGYPSLSEDDIANMNLVKSFESQGASLLANLQATSDLNMRDVAMFRTHLEDACMRLTRAIAKPASPFES